MNKDNKVIQGLWIGSELSLMEQLSISSFLKNGHDYHLYIYGDVKNIPSGTTIKDANDILPESRVFTYQSGWGKGSYAGFSNFFRYFLLKNYGGWWADTDVVCLKYFDFPSNCVISSSYEGKWGEPANSCVLKLPVDSALANYLVDICSNVDPMKIKFGETGPHLVQKGVVELDLRNYVVPHEMFCPITWRAVNKKIVFFKEKITIKKSFSEIKDFIRPIIKPYTKSGKIKTNSYAVHLWNEIWRQNNLDKNIDYDKNCLYEILKQKYL